MEKSWEDQHLRESIRCNFGCCVRRCRPLQNSPCCLEYEKASAMVFRTFLRSRLSLSSIVLKAKAVVISCKWGPVFCRANPLIRAHFWIFHCRFGSQIEVTRPGAFLRYHWRQQLSGNMCIWLMIVLITSIYISGLLFYLVAFVVLFVIFLRS